MQWLDGIFHARTGKCVFGQMLRVCPWIIHSICNDSWAPWLENRLRWSGWAGVSPTDMRITLNSHLHTKKLCNRGWLVKQVKLEPVAVACGCLRKMSGVTWNLNRKKPQNKTLNSILQKLPVSCLILTTSCLKGREISKLGLWLWLTFAAGGWG